MREEDTHQQEQLLAYWTRRYFTEYTPNGIMMTTIGRVLGREEKMEEGKVGGVWTH